MSTASWLRGPWVLIGAFALLGAVLGLIRWELEPSHAGGDTFWYARQALELHGEDEPEATRVAAEFIVEEGRGSDSEAYVDLTRTIDPRYPAIFETRPLYPLFVASFLPIAQLREAMAIAALLAGVTFAAAFGYFVQRVTGSLVAALGAVVLAFLLPSGKWFAFMLADGWMLAFHALALALGCWYLLDPRVRYLAGAAACVVLVYPTKPASGAALVAAFVLVAIGAWVFHSSRRMPAAFLAVVIGIIGLAQVVTYAILGLPGFETTLQDMFTFHFSVPDVDNAVGRLLSRDLEVVGMALSLPLQEPLLVLALAALLAPLLWARESWTTLWLIAGLASTLTILVHPVTSEFPRLLAPIWVSGALGGGLWIAAWRRGFLRVSRRRLERSHSGHAMPP